MINLRYKFHIFKKKVIKHYGDISYDYLMLLCLVNLCELSATITVRNGTQVLTFPIKSVESVLILVF